MACNLGESPATFDVEGNHQLVLASDPNVFYQSGAIYLPAEPIALFENLEADVA